MCLKRKKNSYFHWLKDYDTIFWQSPGKLGRHRASSRATTDDKDFASENNYYNEGLLHHYQLSLDDINKEHVTWKIQQIG